MLLEIFVALVLFQEPAAQTAVVPSGQETGAAAPAPEAAPPASSRRERRAEMVCENRAPTGSVMTRRMCRSPRRAEAEQAAARVYVGQVTAGSVNEPPPQ